MAYYVNTDVAGGLGDGSSLPNAFSTLSDAIDQYHADAPSGASEILCHATAGTADTSNPTTIEPVSGSTLTLKTPVAYRHDGKWDTSTYRLSLGPGNLLTIWDNFPRGSIILEGLQFEKTSVTANYDPILAVTDVEGLSISKCIFKGANSSTYRERLVSLFTRANNIYIWNNLFYNVNNIVDHIANSVFRFETDENIYFYNNTCIGGSRFFYGSGTETIIGKNNIFYDQGDSIQGTWDTVNSETNSSDQSTIPSNNSNDRVSQTFSFTDSANDDYSLTSSDSGARDHGTDLSSDSNLSFSDDIEGNSRSGTWDIGAYEYTAIIGVLAGIYYRTLLQGGM